MELSKLLIGENSLREMTSGGELLPDPNLIYNIDHLSSFIQMELEAWNKHSKELANQLLQSPDVFGFALLLKEENARIYVKALFNVATYYMACVQALEKLIAQLYKISTIHYELKVKKPKLAIDEVFHRKAQFVREKSFVHQNSEQIKNPMDKRTAMSWTPTIFQNKGESLNCENYQFGSGKWCVEINGSKTETEIDITIKGLVEFSEKSQEQIEIRKLRVVNYYNEIKHNKAQQHFLDSL